MPVAGHKTADEPCPRGDGRSAVYSSFFIKSVVPPPSVVSTKRVRHSVLDPIPSDLWALTRPKSGRRLNETLGVIVVPAAQGEPRHAAFKSRAAVADTTASVQPQHARSPAQRAHSTQGQRGRSAAGARRPDTGPGAGETGGIPGPQHREAAEDQRAGQAPIQLGAAGHQRCSTRRGTTSTLLPPFFHTPSLSRRLTHPSLSRRESAEGHERACRSHAELLKSLPQTRQRALNALTRAANRGIPLEASPPPTVATHSLNIHNPEPRSTDRGQGPSAHGPGSRSSSHADKRSGKRRESGKAVAFDLERDKASDHPPRWYDVVDVAWEDHKKYGSTFQPDPGDGTSVEAGGPSSASGQTHGSSSRIGRRGKRARTRICDGAEGRQLHNL